MLRSSDTSFLTSIIPVKDSDLKAIRIQDHFIFPEAAVQRCS